MNKYLTILIIGVLAASLHAGAQDKESKKFKSISKRNLKLDQSVDELLADAEDLLDEDVKAALGKVEEALAVSLTNKNVLEEARCHNMLGRINERIGEWSLAAENYQHTYDALGNAHTGSDEFRTALDGLIRSYKWLGEVDASMRLFRVKQKLARSAKERAEVNLDMAVLNTTTGNYDEAKRQLDLADEQMSTYQPDTLTSDKARAQAIRAKILAAEGQPEAAQEILQQSQQLDFEDDVAKEAFEQSRQEIISAYSKEERLEDEIDLRNQAITSNTLQPKAVVKERQALSKLYKEQGNTPEAIRQLEGALALADSLDDSEEVVVASKALAEAWYESGNSAKSLDYYRRYSEAVDELKREEATRQEEKTGIIRKQQDIKSLSKDLALDESEYNLERTSSQLAANRMKLQLLVIYGLLLVLIIVIVASFFIYRNAVKSRTMSQLLALKSLRSQMNPHFIFNALNSVNQFIASNDERAANRFLSEFSKLMRLVLDNSQRDFITLAEEKEIIGLYLKLEHYRFRDKFDYELIIDEDISLDGIEVPPMLIQPYIENAIWHGLRYKEEHGRLDVRMMMEGEVVRVVITDDGIGRRRSKELKTENQKKHNSTGLKNTQERIRIINRVYKKDYAVKVTDLNGDGSGTRVEVLLG